MQPNSQEPVVIHLTGRAGVGKTHLLETFLTENPGSIQLLTPTEHGQVFDPASAEWNENASVAVDEVLMWDAASVRADLLRLEAHAKVLGKKLILVTQGTDCLQRADIALTTTPRRIHLERLHDNVTLNYDGRTLYFPDETASDASAGDGVSP